MKHALFLTLFLYNTVAFGQNFEKISFNSQDENDYYILLKPPIEDIKGVLVLLPGYGEPPESIFPESKLFNVAYANGIMTMAIAGGQKIYADESVGERINSGISDLIQRYPSLDRSRFVFGGYSAGGTIALRYVEYCIENPDKYPIQPKGVFTVDSPIDLFDIYDYFQREIDRNNSQSGVNEAKLISGIMEKEIGTPAINEQRYNQLTPFKAISNQYGNERFLKNISVRLYVDMDTKWQLKERNRSLYDTNQLTASELIRRLLKEGNDKAEFMASNQPGYRSNGLRHPHSWSIVDEIECIQWILKLLD